LYEININTPTLYSQASPLSSLERYVSFSAVPAVENLLWWCPVSRYVVLRLPQPPTHADIYTSRAAV